MTIRQALAEFDERRPNEFGELTKIEWLSILDERIYIEIICTHSGAKLTEFEGYNADTDRDTELMANNTYRDLYFYYLESQMDYERGEMERYNNSSDMFNTRYEEFAAYYNRTHMPLGQKGYRI